MPRRMDGVWLERGPTARALGVPEGTAPGPESDAPPGDHVDRIVPPHYSAAPSGDLCTTLRQSFVVRGESRSSVLATGENRSGSVARLCPGRSRRESPGPLSRGDGHLSRSDASSAAPLFESPLFESPLFESSSVNSLRFESMACASGPRDSVPRKNASKIDSEQDIVSFHAWKPGASPSEQMKHDTCNARALEFQALNGHRDRAPRNRFFT